MESSDPDAPPAVLGASFRDPAGFLYRRDGVLYRQVNRRFEAELDAFLGSGLYQELVDAALFLPHEECDLRLAATGDAFKVLRPRLIPFVSYPYEWSFSQLRDAALTTLEIQRRALNRGFVLRDASAFNIQFLGSRPVFIDTLSLEPWTEGQPWVAYRQFCQHFVAPLALMSKVDVRLLSLFRTHLDGVPLDLASRLLPRRSWLRLGLAVHVLLHAKSQGRHARGAQVRATSRGRFGKASFSGWIDSLSSCVRHLQLPPMQTEWESYYRDNHNYGEAGLSAKEAIVREFLEEVDATSAWDLGANIGRFSRLCTERGMQTVAWDVDPLCVERNYLQARKEGDPLLLPLLQDLTNPSPGLGWDSRERDSFEARSQAELVLALGLIHHLAIGKNVPLPRLAAHFARLGKSLIVELVPKQDTQVQKLLSSRPDIFDSYNEASFEEVFQQHFDIVKRRKVPGTERSLYFMRRRR